VYWSQLIQYKIHCEHGNGPKTVKYLTSQANTKIFWSKTPHRCVGSWYYDPAFLTVVVLRGFLHTHSLAKTKENLNHSFSEGRKQNDYAEYKMLSSWYYIPSFLLTPVCCSYLYTVEGKWNFNVTIVGECAVHPLIVFPVINSVMLLLPLKLKCAKGSPLFRSFNQNSVYISISVCRPIYRPINFISAVVVPSMRFSH
jgi:hypothetical protein